ncbi:MAG: pentapeptide repeat-containing protein [Alphaproteobacteria bacterium]|nr:pentapeptide repeat-containing protein [Alphaproteobacteria bacterium]
MKNYKLISKDTEKTLFSGFFQDFKTCLEEAVSRRIPLNKINLSGKNLSNANLDDGIFGEADFTNTNLTGANISESYCKGANFENASLFNTCLAYSNLTGCNFKHASFGATDMSAAIIDRAQFSTLSAFTIDFTKIRQMRGCTYHAHDGQISTLSKPPIVITGIAPSPIIMLDDHVYTGHHRILLTAESEYVKIH